MTAHQLKIGTETKKIAFFLGAGASVPFKIPATDKILPIILQALDQEGGFFDALPDVVIPGGQQDVPAGQLGTWSDGHVTIRARHFLKDCLLAIFPGLFGDPGPRRDLARQRFTITELLSIIDHLLLTRSSVAPNIAPLHLEKMRNLLEGAIAITLHARPTKELATGMGEKLSAFVDWMIARAEHSQHSVAIVTTNYDVVLESAVYRKVQKLGSPLRDRFSVKDCGFQPVLGIDYGQSWRVPYDRDRDTGEEPVQHRPQGRSLSIMKLHGSLNWLQCPLCHYVYINHQGEIDAVADQEHKSEGNSCSCGAWPLQRVLVAPSLVRDVRNVALLSIWDAALEELRCANRWIFVGYSLPPDDVAIRSMLVRALLGRSLRPAIDVIERPLAEEEGDGEASPDRNELRARYRVLLGNPQFWPIGMEGLIQSLLDR